MRSHRPEHERVESVRGGGARLVLGHPGAAGCAGECYRGSYMAEYALARAFCDAHPEGAGASEDLARIELELGSALASAREAWPTVDVDPVAFVRRAAAHCDRLVGAKLHWKDLYLAYGCAVGSATATALFTERFTPELARVASDLEAPDAEEFQQQVFAKLLTGTPPRIEEYSGRGELRHWVRVVAVRARMDRARRAKVAAARDPRVDAPPPIPEVDPELGYFRAHYRELLGAAFERAVEALEPADRNLLRQHLVGGLSTRALGLVFGVDKSTVSRWLSAARGKLLDGTRQHLMEELGMGNTEFDSVVRLVSDELDVSIVRLLE